MSSSLQIFTPKSCTCRLPHASYICQLYYSPGLHWRKRSNIWHWLKVMKFLIMVLPHRSLFSLLLGWGAFQHLYPKPTIISVKTHIQLSIIIWIHCQPRLSQAYQFIHYYLPFTRTRIVIRKSEMCNHITRILRKWSWEKYYEHKNTAIFWTHPLTVNILAFVCEAGLRHFSEHCRHKSLFAFAAVATGLCVLQSVWIVGTRHGSVHVSLRGRTQPTYLELHVLVTAV